MAGPKVPPKPTLDCRTCGACCLNPDENVRMQFIDYVDVRPYDELITRPGLMRRLVRWNDRNEPHLKLLENRRCVALRGEIGVDVRCGIYELRPAVCADFVAGEPRCLELRRERGVDPPLPEPSSRGKDRSPH